jgi:hypothetical protein
MIQVPKIAAMAVLLAAGAARADGYLESEYRLGTLVSVTWEVARPGGGLRDFVDATSARGGQLDVRFGVARHLSLGLATSWNWFSQNFSQLSANYPNATVTSPAYRRAQIFTLRAAGHWYLTDGPLQPYLGLGIGAARDDTYQSLLDFVSTSSRLRFAADPQVGLLFRLGPGVALHAQVRYQLTFDKTADLKNVQWVGGQIGIAVY